MYYIVLPTGVLYCPLSAQLQVSNPLFNLHESILSYQCVCREETLIV